MAPTRILAREPQHQLGFVFHADRLKHFSELRTYVVTGCAGFIGSHLAEALLARGHAVVGVDAFTDYYARGLKEANVDVNRSDVNFQLLEADLAADALEPLFEGVDGVFHLAAQPGVRGSWGETFALYARDNVLATQRLFEAAVAADVRVVWASSSSVYGNAATRPTLEDARPRPISPYGVTKLSCEHLADAYTESFGLDQIAVRYFTVYGPRQRPDMAFTKIVHSLADGRPFSVFGTGDQTRDVTYVADAVEATTAAMENAPPGAVYNVGGGSATTLNDVIALCERLAGRVLDRRPASAVAGDVRATSADITRAWRELGWGPRTALEDGLAAHLRWAGLDVDRSAVPSA